MRLPLTEERLWWAVTKSVILFSSQLCHPDLGQSSKCRMTSSTHLGQCLNHENGEVLSELSVLSDPLCTECSKDWSKLERLM